MLSVISAASGDASDCQAHDEQGGETIEKESLSGVALANVRPDKWHCYERRDAIKNMD